MNIHRPSDRYTSVSYEPVHPRKRKLRGVLFVLFAAALLGVGLHLELDNKAAARAATLAEAQRHQSLQHDLSARINNVINQNPQVTFSVSLIDLSSNKSINAGTPSAMEAASTAKLITAADFLHQVESGKESLTEQLGGYSAKYELKQMINQSDDTAWSNLNQELDNDQIQAYANSIGLSSYDVYRNQISAADIAKLLAKLYKGNLLNSSDTKMLLGFMQNTNYEDLIPPAVPVGDQIYHKVGELDDYVHDASIITNGRQSFVLVIFTNGNGTYNWDARASIMQQITKLALPAYLD